MTVVVLGDYIEDRYVFGESTRLCPEAPVPVLVPQRERVTAGGAGLVANQLIELGACVPFPWFGSYSEKTRYFAGSHLIARIDRDSLNTKTIEPLNPQLLEIAEAFVISDYGKGAMTRELAQKIISTGKPCFVDSKNNWGWYQGAIIFPNEHEVERAENMFVEGKTAKFFPAVVRKLGAHGAAYRSAAKDERGIPIEFYMPATTGDVVDVTGAGDVFIASFVFAATMQPPLPPEGCLEFATTMAGRSCQFLGTHVVDREFAQSVLDRLRVSKESPQLTPDLESYSNSEEHQRAQQLYPLGPSVASILASRSNQYVDYLQDSTGLVTAEGSLQSSQTPHQSPSDPTESSDPQLHEVQESSDDVKLRPDVQNQSPTVYGHLCGSGSKRDRVLHPKKA
jgi:bifunctional ADP-heptose synthase (sugar kinase/adenylyltransferase)